MSGEKGPQKRGGCPDGSFYDLPAHRCVDKKCYEEKLRELEELGIPGAHRIAMNWCGQDRPTAEHDFRMARKAVEWERNGQEALAHGRQDGEDDAEEDDYVV